VDHKILSYTLPASLTGTFRASGRFFWLAGYLILFAVLLTIVKAYGRKSLLLLFPAILIQWIDTANVRDTFIARAATVSHHPSHLIDISTERERIFVYPSYKCNERNADVYLLLQNFAARHGKVINTGYIARSHGDCETDLQRLHESDPNLNTYVLFSDYTSDQNALPHWLQQAIQSRECSTSQRLTFCSP